MSKEDEGIPVGAFFLSLLVFVGLTLFFSFLANHDGRNQGIKEMQLDAVKKGVARWETITNSDGNFNTEFKWIIPTEKKEK